MCKTKQNKYAPFMSKERQKYLRQWDIGVYDTLIEIKDSKDYELMGVSLRVYPGVHAGLWTDTQLLGKALKKAVKEGDKVLDLGTGTGIHSIIAAKVTDHVTAVDFNEKSIKNAKENFEKNKVVEKIEILESNGFSKLQGKKFDIISINPPFRWFRPKDILDAASNDENYIFLNKFLSEAKKYLTEKGKILLVFANTADIGYLQYLFGLYKYNVRVVEEERPDEWRVYKVFELTDMGDCQGGTNGACC
jgi:release factor glutamine methyltransferase